MTEKLWAIQAVGPDDYHAKTMPKKSKISTMRNGGLSVIEDPRIQQFYAARAAIAKAEGAR